MLSLVKDKDGKAVILHKKTKKKQKKEHCKLTNRSLYRNDSAPNFLIYLVVNQCSHIVRQNVLAAALKTTVTYNIHALQEPTEERKVSASYILSS